MTALLRNSAHSLLLLALSYFGYSQVSPVSPTPYLVRQVAGETSAELRLNSTFTGLPINNVGPNVCSGRVTSIAVNPKLPSHFFVAYASGGLWYTQNNGTTFTPIFDDQPSITIGAIAVNWVDSLIWVGTGEVNSSRSSYAGTGMYLSEDWGKTWKHRGLAESHHIGRILLDDRDPSSVHVAVLGHLYSDNPERGVYSSSDLGTTWIQSLSISEKTGAVDIQRDGSNPDIILAAMWQRERKAWNFTESGAESGIYKSTDNGSTWSLLSTPDSGFPTGNGVGRIGLAISAEGTFFAILDNYARRDTEQKNAEAHALTSETLQAMSKAEFAQIDLEDIQAYLEENAIPKRYSAEKVRSMVKVDSLTLQQLATYNQDANQLLFDTEVVGAEVYRSDDRGVTWSKTHEDYLDGLYYSYGYYFGQIRVSPNNENELYIMGVPLLKSLDAGKTWRRTNSENVHADHHELWLNPYLPGHMINGNDGGINITYDGGDSWIKCNNPQVGQFYTVNVDNATPYNIYGGLQDNGVWKGSHKAQANNRWHMSGTHPYSMIMGGDGMQVQIDPNNNAIVYTGYQFGNYYKLNLETKENTYITPKHDLGDQAYRWNWQSPILVSAFNSDIVYMGSNKLLRSMDGGMHFSETSDDLTNGGIKGDVAYGTLTTLSESKLEYGVMYTGSDDGLIHVTRDAGFTWSRIDKDLPQHMWVSRIVASQHTKGTVYATLNGYRWDDWTAYVYVSHDYGQTWENRTSNLPNSPVNVLVEDNTTAETLYVGTDAGLYLSLDAGETWKSIGDQMPNVPVHDMAIQVEAADLVVGTHGRSMYIVDLTPIRNTPTDESIVILVENIKHSKRWGTQTDIFLAEKAIEHELYVYAPIAGTAEIFLKTQDGKTELNKLNSDLNHGWNTVSIPLSHAKRRGKEINYLEPGKYNLELRLNGTKKIKEFEVLEE